MGDVGLSPDSHMGWLIGKEGTESKLTRYRNIHRPYAHRTSKRFAWPRDESFPSRKRRPVFLVGTANIQPIPCRASVF